MTSQKDYEDSKIDSDIDYVIDYDIEIRQDELLYLQKSSQLPLDKIKENISKFKTFNYTIIGCGGVGSITAELLVRSGIKKLTLIDLDIIEKSNLGRQNYTYSNLGESKVQCLKNRLLEISPNCEINCIEEFLRESNYEKLLQDSEIIIDCLDNLNTRRIINQYCINSKKMWIYSAGQGFESTCLILDYRTSQKDVFSKIITPNTTQNATCQEGVLNSTTHMSACFIINELIKYICLDKQESHLIKFNSLQNKFFNISL